MSTSPTKIDKKRLLQSIHDVADLGSDNSDDTFYSHVPERMAQSVIPGMGMEELLNDDDDIKSKKRRNSFDGQEYQPHEQEQAGFFGQLVQGIDDATFLPDINEYKDEDEDNQGTTSVDSSKGSGEKDKSGGAPIVDFDFDDIADQFDNMDFGEKDIIVNMADNVAVKLVNQTRKKLAKIMSENKNVAIAKQKKDKLLANYKKKQVKLQRYISTANFTRFSDKITFIYGVLQLVCYTFIIGRFPNDFLYTFHIAFMTLMIFGKWAYYKSKGWHYYMTDFCYLASAIVNVFLWLFPQNQALFILSFCYANGCVATSVGAFRNQMVFHKIDNLTSLALHMIPQATLWNLRWTTIPWEQTLPEDQRKFIDLKTIENNIQFADLWKWPIMVYLVWFSIYYAINFVIAIKRIRARNYDNMLLLYEKQAFSRKILYKFGKEKVGFMFFCVHFSFFMVGHCVSLLSFYSYTFHTFSICLWLSWSIWNGSKFYMDYFSKKYESSLQKMVAVENELKEKYLKEKEGHTETKKDK